MSEKETEDFADQAWDEKTEVPSRSASKELGRKEAELFVSGSAGQKEIEDSSGELQDNVQAQAETIEEGTNRCDRDRAPKTTDDYCTDDGAISSARLSAVRYVSDGILPEDGMLPEDDRPGATGSTGSEGMDPAEAFAAHCREEIAPLPEPPRRGAVLESLPGAYAGNVGTELERRETPGVGLLGAAARANRNPDEGDRGPFVANNEMQVYVHNPTHESGLARAVPVQERPVLDIELQQIDIDAMNQRQSWCERQKRKFCLASMGLLCVAATLVLGSIIGLKNKNHTPLPTVSPTMAPSDTPSSAPSGILDSRLAALPDYTLASLTDPFSAQSKALGWLMNHQNISNLEEWRKVQLLALATIYHSWDGPTWPNGLNKDWLDDTRSECLWYSSPSYVINPWSLGTGTFKGIQGNISCNEAQEIQILSLSHALNLRGQRRAFPRQVGLLTNLVAIDLANVDLNASLANDILPALSSLPKLEALRLMGNALTGTIPSNIDILSSLVHLDVDFNKLSGVIPTEMGMWSGLTSIKIGANMLSGPLPSELSQLSKLKELDFLYNKLAGQIPSQIFQIPSLEVLDLTFNSFSGSMPSEIGLMAGLKALRVNNNGLSGPIPSECGLLTALEDLGFGWNTLLGPIPSEISMLRSLTRLRFNDNQLSGNIPSSLGLLESMDDLFLGGNNFSGQIPTEFGMLHGLTLLDLENNMLAGPIPSELGLLNNVRELYLSGNMLAETIPEEVALLSSLVSLYLNANMLTGQIPNTWASLDSNSSAVDFPPSNAELGSWEPSSLQVLQFSNNYLLAGTIPNDLCRMNTQACNTYYFSFVTYAWEAGACEMKFDCTELLCGCGPDCPCPGEPTRAPTMPPTPLSCDEGLLKFELHLHTDDYAEETGWSLMDCAGIESLGADTGHYEGSVFYLDQFCVPNDTAYVFTIRDTYGDGLAPGEGWYQMYYDGELIGAGGTFLFNESWTFGGNCSG